MGKTIEKLMGGVAFGMTGIGPKPVFSPPNEGGNGGGNDDGNGDGNGSGDDNGGSGGDVGDAGGADDGKQGGKPSSKLAGKGLFGQRKDGGGDSGSDNGDGGDDAGTGEKDADGRPKGLADKFWNAKEKTINVDALLKAQRDGEKLIGDLKRQKGGGEVPETEAGYFEKGVTVPDDADRFTGLTVDDPGVKAWAATCKKHGVGKELANSLFSDMLVQMNEHAAVPIDPEQEMASLGKGGPALVDGLFVWLEGMERAGDLSEDDLIVVDQMSQTANGIRLLAKFRNMSGEKPIPVTPGSGTRGMSQEQWHDEYKKAVAAKDYKRQEELDAMGEQINGTEPGISGRPGGLNI